MQVTPSQAEESTPSPRQPRPRQPRSARTEAEQATNAPPASSASGPLPTSVLQIVALFERRSSALRFPNVDAESLRALVERVEQQRGEAADALANWETARVASERSEVELLEMSKRAIAYARVFAADDPALETELDAILRTEPERGKRRKRDAGDATAAAATESAEPAKPRRVRRDSNETKSDKASDKVIAQETPNAAE